MYNNEELKEMFGELDERKVFTKEEEAAMVLMYSIDYPVQFQDAGLTIEGIVKLKEKNMKLLEEAESLIPLVQNILALPAIVAQIETEEDAYV
jgi:hypothetical protein